MNVHRKLIGQHFDSMLTQFEVVGAAWRFFVFHLVPSYGFSPLAYHKQQSKEKPTLTTKRYAAAFDSNFLVVCLLFRRFLETTSSKTGEEAATLEGEHMMPSLHPLLPVGWAVWAAIIAVVLYILLTVDKQIIGWKETPARRATAPGEFIKLSHGDTHYTFTPAKPKEESVRIILATYFVELSSLNKIVPFLGYDVKINPMFLQIEHRSGKQRKAVGSLFTWDVNCIRNVVSVNQVPDRIRF